jgi:catechol 2,3-dioxygenase-like lactoylglutathione lyase family enzyme
MIAHLSIGARDIARARSFYDAALKPLGYTCLSSDEGSLGYGAKAAEYWINRTEHPVAADDRSGLHICFTAPDRDAVDAFHKAALKVGGKDNGSPDCAPHMALTTMPRLWWIRTAIGSRPGAARNPDRAVVLPVSPGGVRITLL